MKNLILRTSVKSFFGWALFTMGGCDFSPYALTGGQRYQALHYHDSSQPSQSFETVCSASPFFLRQDRDWPAGVEPVINALDEISLATNGEEILVKPATMNPNAPAVYPTVELFYWNDLADKGVVFECVASADRPTEAVCKPAQVCVHPDNDRSRERACHALAPGIKMSLGRAVENGGRYFPAKIELNYQSLGGGITTFGGDPARSDLYTDNAESLTPCKPFSDTQVFLAEQAYVPVIEFEERVDP